MTGLRLTFAKKIVPEPPGSVMRLDYGSATLRHTL